MNEFSLSALVVSIIREFNGIIFITVIIAFYIVSSVFDKFFRN